MCSVISFMLIVANSNDIGFGMRLILSNQQVDVIINHSNQKDEGYDGRGVDHSSLLYDISF